MDRWMDGHKTYRRHLCETKGLYSTIRLMLALPPANLVTFSMSHSEFGSVLPRCNPHCESTFAGPGQLSSVTHPKG